MFYYRAARLIGDVDIPASVGKDFNWVSLKEIPEYIKDENLVGYLNRVLESIVFSQREKVFVFLFSSSSCVLCRNFFSV